MDQPISPNAPVPLSEAYAGEYALVCPTCGDLYVHPVKVSVENLFGTMQVDIISTGVQTQIQEGAPSARGVVIRQALRCEQGHTWWLSLTFHKGHTLITTTTTLDPLPEDTIWRD